MKTNFSLQILILALLLDLVYTKKHHVGPCLVVTEPEPCPDPDYIQLYLYTRENPENGQYIEFFESSDNLTSSNFNPKNSNKIIIHGFNTDMNLDVLQNIKAEYLKQNDANIWMVNYPKLVEKSWCYLTAIVNIEHVGKCLAPVVTGLRRHKSNDIHIIGFSLGAQVANYLANTLGKNKLPRITGLDPAGPGFTLMSKTRRLDPSDAKFVDVIHTNGGLQGDIQTCGHIDFYMNGGITQPGCFDDKQDFLNCNHRRATIYFSESINSKVGFLGWKCKGYLDYIRGKCKPKTTMVLMGEHCSAGSTGLIIAYTASEKPFALGNWTSASYHKRLPKLEFTEFPNDSRSLSSNNPVQRIFLDYYLIRQLNITHSLS
ncbi:lipase member I-like [Macrosteles quadrilineatus]|uniref:lipase member I-like n=1 Tax=Macrosteles quadrilineatus TaxID=74068 RepID=UPI0023E2E2B7|nr:lipase member I-like [Macrosteles quadrilineatus]